MVPGKYDITFVRGGTYNTGITANNDNGSPIAFNAYTSMRMQIRPPWSFITGGVVPAPLFELTTDNGRLVVDADGEGFSIKVSAADTATLSFTEGQYDLELVLEDVVDKLLYGKVSVMGEVTV